MMARIMNAVDAASSGVAVFLIDAYRILLSPLIGPVCRYQPTCSAYAREAILTHGVIRGALFAARRILRCHPWSRSGYDPVPARTPHHHSHIHPPHQAHDTCANRSGPVHG